jgi:hypothetical protein
MPGVEPRRVDAGVQAEPLHRQTSANRALVSNATALGAGRADCAM